jgi:hypothetical protein
MPQSRTLSVGCEGHHAALAVAYSPHAPHAEVVSLGHVGTRQCARAPRLRRRQSTSPPLVLG